MSREGGPATLGLWRNTNRSATDRCNDLGTEADAQDRHPPIGDDIVDPADLRAEPLQAGCILDVHASSQNADHVARLDKGSRDGKLLALVGSNEVHANPAVARPVLDGPGRGGVFVLDADQPFAHARVVPARLA